MNIEERIAQCIEDIKTLRETKEKLEEQKKKSQRAETFPIISFATCNSSNDRVVINLTQPMIKSIKDGAKQITITESGCVGEWRNDYSLTHVYINQKPIFGELKNE